MKVQAARAVGHEVIVNLRAKMALAGGSLAADVEASSGALGKFSGLAVEGAPPFAVAVDVVPVAGRVACLPCVVLSYPNRATLRADGQQAVEMLIIRPRLHNVAAAIADRAGASIRAVVLSHSNLFQFVPSQSLSSSLTASGGAASAAAHSGRFMLFKNFCRAASVAASLSPLSKALPSDAMPPLAPMWGA